MTAAADKRLGRLLGRIAEERAARGRPTTSYRPKVLSTSLSGVEDVPEDRGTPAEFATLEAMPSRPPKSIYLQDQVRNAEGFVLQPNIDIAVEYLLWLEKGVDYGGWIADYSGGYEQPTKVGSKKKPQLEKLDAFEALVNSDDDIDRDENFGNGN